MAKLKLTAALKKDSIEIFDTKGVFYPLTSQWRGTSGRVTWARFGNTDTYCTIGDYAIDMTKGTYRAEKAKLHYPLMFPDRDIDGFLKTV
ncbi:MAG: hypothetical protein HC817_15905 [Saprospiraceae bacterium]|nr:hypothetical protein [Saprospiraceae bacterium]